MQEGEEERFGIVSPSSSPPTPPSPLPVSFGPGNQKYLFSASPTPSPPFTPPQSAHNSAEKLPLLERSQKTPAAPLASAFSVDLKNPNEQQDRSSCLTELLEWILQRCCNCCTKKTSSQHSTDQASPGFV